MILESRAKNRMDVESRIFMDIGPRGGQEDALLAGSRIYQERSMDIEAQDQGEYIPFIVCDGMGGHAAGDLCSRFVLDELKRSLSHQTASEDGIDMILNMVQTAAEGELPLNSGTTIAGVVLIQRQAMVFNAGDSRVYRIRDGVLTRCSHDHSYVQSLVDKGVLTEPEAFLHPYRNVVSFGVGSAFSELWGHTKVHYALYDARPNDSFLVCSDGVSDLLEDHQMEALLKPEPLKAANRLRTELKRKGFKDNTSFILLTLR